MMGVVVVVIVMIRLWWWWWWEWWLWWLWWLDCDGGDDGTVMMITFYMCMYRLFSPLIYFLNDLYIIAAFQRCESRGGIIVSALICGLPNLPFSEITYPRTASKILTFLLFTYFNAFTFWIQLFLLSSANGWVRLKNNMLDLYRYLRTWWQLITAARPACINMLRSCMGYFRNWPKFRTGGKLMIVRC